MVDVSRGGRRAGQPGKSYSNRTDLNVDRAPTAPPNLAPSPAQPQQAAQVAQVPTSAGVPQPGSLGTFAPSQRPNEPITHGLPTGPGGGPEVLTRPGVLRPGADLLSQLRAIYLASPTEPLRELIAFNQDGAQP